MHAANDNELPRTRAEAKEKGLARYYTGEPCKNGHNAARITSNQICVLCDQEWRAENRVALLAGKRERYRANRHRELAYARRYRAENRDKVLAANKRWKVNNPDKVKSDWDGWYAENGRAWGAAQRSIPRNRIDSSMSGGIYGAIRDKKAGRSWESLVGYTLDDLMRHLQRRFQPGMSWGNYGKGGWHIDHKVPKSVFNYSAPEHEDFKRCWSLRNLQPMWEPDNLSKSDKLDSEFQPSLALELETTA